MRNLTDYTKIKMNFTFLFVAFHRVSTRIHDYFQVAR